MDAKQVNFARLDSQVRLGIRDAAKPRMKSEPVAIAGVWSVRTTQTVDGNVISAPLPPNARRTDNEDRLEIGIEMGPTWALNLGPPG